MTLAETGLFEINEALAAEPRLAIGERGINLNKVNVNGDGEAVAAVFESC